MGFSEIHKEKIVFKIAKLRNWNFITGDARRQTTARLLVNLGGLPYKGSSTLLNIYLWVQFALQ